MELVSFARGDDATVAFRIMEVFCGSESIRFFCLFAFRALRNVGKFLYDLVSCLVSYVCLLSRGIAENSM